jgi:hypothetical protein
MIEEIPFPIKKDLEWRNCFAFNIREGRVSFGVVYKQEPLISGRLGIHISITKTITRAEGIVPWLLYASDLCKVADYLREVPLEWPKRYKRVPFSVGPFKSYGTHLFQED